MKKFFLILISIFILNGCATAPTGNVQKTLIDEGSIKVGMKLDALINTLGGSGASYLHWIKINKTYKYVYVTPYTSQYGKEAYNNQYYSFEQIVVGKNSRVQNYKLTHIWNDIIDAHDHYIKILPSGKKRNYFLKNKAYYLSQKNYQDWKNSKNKKTVKKSKTQSETTKESQAASGTAFFIDNNGHLVTNYHVIEGCNNQSKISYKGIDINVNLVAKDRYLDLALLKADIKNKDYISFSNDNPKKLERIIVAGYPFGKVLSDDLKFTSGIITSLKGFMDDSTRLQIDAAINPGNSGGPIVYEKNGQLAGVAVSGLRKDKTEGMNFGIKTSSVQNFLKSNQIDILSKPKKFNFDKSDLASLLESSTIYTYCN